MRDVLKYDLDTSGILAAFPYILMAIVVQVKKSHNYLYNQKQSYKQKNWGCSCELAKKHSWEVISHSILMAIVVQMHCKFLTIWKNLELTLLVGCLKEEHKGNF